MRNKRPRLVRCIICVFVVAVMLFGVLLYFLSKGVPLHDFRLWRLEKNFKAVAIYHPPESIVLQKKTYLGGPYTHGSLTCDFFVGELRSATLFKEEIRRAYDGHFIKSFDNSGQVPLEVLFFGEKIWPVNSPLGDWWDEWRESSLVASSSGTVYFVFATQKGYPFLLDPRCDD
ncbi:MAG: hypothetical protein UV05_C0012G0004 [candidate division CPR1 bacterium GW2011_GWA2_42_17]|uniref:Uncharacterized protein n=1 Tax=candidate division CPR1 bacterium GW2011_GWA2_42_17 TaxID=1618341 RepID=A0A0G0Z5T5_9BACT|nr:MAG: hypothetical protein UV05_C0012G0004 [candidate division CPR1 bacterium GW2011_GWA2_42_17]